MHGKNIRGQQKAMFAKKCRPLLLKHGKDPDKRFNKTQLNIGTKVEMEHTSDPEIAEQIAKAHLSERKDYYKVLKSVNL